MLRKCLPLRCQMFFRHVSGKSFLTNDMLLLDSRNRSESQRDSHNKSTTVWLRSAYFCRSLHGCGLFEASLAMSFRARKPHACGNAKKGRPHGAALFGGVFPSRRTEKMENRYMPSRRGRKRVMSGKSTMTTSARAEAASMGSTGGMISSMVRLLIFAPT